MKAGFIRFMPLGLLCLLLFGISALEPAMADEGNIHTDQNYAWSEIAGWINFRPEHGGVTLHDNGGDGYITGYAWAENIGWIKLGNDSGGPYNNTSASDWGVNADAGGNLSGYAWSEIAGWISFNPDHSQVTFDRDSGSFDGYAWAENIGWIHFKHTDPAYNVVTPRLSVNDITVDEDSGPARFTITLSQATGVDVTFDYATAGGTASAGDDYTETGGSATIAAGTTSATVDVPITNDGEVNEPEETFTFALSNVNGASFADNEATGTIIDEESDSDGDGMLDWWEEANGLDPSVDDSGLDPDNDGLSNLEEYDNGTDPNIGDTDNDDIPDAWEVDNGLDPLDNSGDNGRDGDLDNDGWSNYEEYVEGTDPNDDTSPAPTPPEIVGEIPHDGAGIDDTTRIPGNTSFAVLIQDSDGIDVTDTDSVEFTINDGVNPEYRRDLSHDTIRYVKLTDDPDTAVTGLWIVYDRSGDGYGNYAYDTSINVKVDARDRRGDSMTRAGFDFHIETEQDHDDALANSPDTAPADTAGTLYDAGVVVTSGELEGAKILYDSSEPVAPTFGPTDELPLFDVTDTDAVGSPMNLQPPVVFNNPVMIFIPCPWYTDVSSLSVYLYNGTAWVLACDADGIVQSGGQGWMVPGSRVNHNDYDPHAIEIQVYHFTGVQAGAPRAGGNGGTGGGAGCFIATAAYGSLMEPLIQLLLGFRDRFLLTNPIGQAFVDLYYTYSPPLANLIAKYDMLRVLVRWSLLPLIGVSWLTLHFGPCEALIMLLLALISITASVVFKKTRFRHY